MSRILLTNDDGISAPGLASLRRALDTLGEVVTIAPRRNASAMGRAITIDRPLTIEDARFGDGFEGIAVDGTPVDCVRIAMLGVVSPPPDAVLVGINNGANLGSYATYSGTVGAALEASHYGLPGVAISVDSRTPRYFESIEPLLAALIERLLLAPLPHDVVLNVTFPDLPADELRGVTVTSLGGIGHNDSIVLHDGDGLRGEYQIVHDDRRADASTIEDRAAVAAGYVSLTPLEFNWTSSRGLVALAGWPVADLFGAPQPAAD